MKTKILSAVAALAVLAAVTGTSTNAAEAHGVRYGHSYQPTMCGFKWTKVYSKFHGHKVWKQKWGCGPIFYF